MFPIVAACQGIKDMNTVQFGGELFRSHISIVEDIGGNCFQSSIFIFKKSQPFIKSDGE